ncbi:MAG: tetratricopeptide repeat protein, partial [Oceanidesulfovibrio sp.]
MFLVAFSPFAGTFRTLLLTALLAAAMCSAPASAQAFNYYWGKHPDKDRIVVKFDGDVPRHTVSRTGETTLDITLPDGFWAGKRRPPGLLMAMGANADRITPTDDGLRIDMKNSSFGYIHFVLEDADKLVIDVFEDSLGARWEPGDQQPAPDPVASAETPTPEPLPEPEAEAEAQPVREPQPAPATLVEVVEEVSPTPAGEATEVTVVEVAQEEPAQEHSFGELSELPAVEKEPQPVSEPAFSFRAPLPSRGPAREAESSVDAPAPAEQGNPLLEPPSAPEPAVDPVVPAPSPAEAGPEEPAPVTEQREQLEQEEQAGPVDETVVVVEDQGPSYALRAPMPRRGEETTVFRRSPRQSESVEVAEEVPAITAPGEYIMDEPPADNGTTEAESPPPPVIDTQAAKQAQADAEDAFKAAQDEEEQEGPAPMPLEQTASEEVAPRPTVAEPAAQEQNRTGPGGEPLPTNEELLEQTRMAFVNQDYETALTLLDQLRRVPGLTDEEREEVLYFRADSLYAMHKDDIRTHYEEVTSAYKEAMNFNPDSASMPQALLKMGVINLEVDNPREAEAYFNILRTEYAGDPNIPLTYFYWGDYYFDHGRYQEAADSYQYIIQQYPDSKYVRESGVGLARSL